MKFDTTIEDPEAMLTAYALGELPAVAAATVAARVAGDPLAHAFVLSQAQFAGALTGQLTVPSMALSAAQHALIAKAAAQGVVLKTASLGLATKLGIGAAASVLGAGMVVVTVVALHQGTPPAPERDAARVEKKPVPSKPEDETLQAPKLLN